MSCFYCSKLENKVIHELSFGQFENAKRCHMLAIFQEFILSRYIYDPIDMPLHIMRLQLPAAWVGCLDEIECDQEFCGLLLALNAYFDA